VPTPAPTLSANTKPGIAPSPGASAPTLGPKPVAPSLPSVAPAGLPPLGASKPPIPLPGAPDGPSAGAPLPPPGAPASPQGSSKKTAVAAPDTKPAKPKPSILFLLLDFLVFGGSVAGCVFLFLNY
jgi:hypothetical protein